MITVKQIDTFFSKSRFNFHFLIVYSLHVFSSHSRIGPPNICVWSVDPKINEINESIWFL